MSREYRTTHCRFCKKWTINGQGMVKYGVRHYAHFRCYAASGKDANSLPSYQREKLSEALRAGA